MVGVGIIYIVVMIYCGYMTEFVLLRDLGNMKRGDRVVLVAVRKCGIVVVKGMELGVCRVTDLRMV